MRRIRAALLLCYGLWVMVLYFAVSTVEMLFGFLANQLDSAMADIVRLAGDKGTS